MDEDDFPLILPNTHVRVQYVNNGRCSLIEVRDYKG
jgi:hypothetical protein